MMGKLFYYTLFGFSFFTLLAGLACSGKATSQDQDLQSDMQPSVQPMGTSIPITLFLAGDVMLGRGIDQVLPHPSDPTIHESYVVDARGYVDLAEQANGPIQKPVDFAYIWGDALEELERAQPDLRLINLETSITTSEDYWENKGIHYRMHPGNIDSLITAKVDYCSLANNHVLDWGYAGLAETYDTLQNAHIRYAGAGLDLQEAAAPAVMAVEGKGRVIVFSYGLETSGIPASWAASGERPGVNLLENLSDQAIQLIKAKVAAVKQDGDIVITSIHWGGNWGYQIPPEQSAFAHELIDEAGVDVVHGHSSHHVKGIEVYKDKAIIYGSGDFLNDYEGIGGYEEFRSDLALMYLLSVDATTGNLVDLQMKAMQIRNFKSNRASSADARWLRDVLNREGEKLGTRVEMDQEDTLTLKWD
jgi:poly-gamma-glutamate capsule biosynthesis protein CapA/YwtB (metallophosphatase superfamily)